MNKKESKQYTTIQIDKNIADEIRGWCKINNIIISKQTETLWVQFLSASMALTPNTKHL
jgi:hypothetical protein